MKKARKYLCVAIVMAMCMMFSMTAAAAYSSINAGVYGTLTGNLSLGSGQAMIYTTITQNPNGAALKSAIGFTRATTAYIDYEYSTSKVDALQWMQYRAVESSAVNAVGVSYIVTARGSVLYSTACSLAL